MTGIKQNKDAEEVAIEITEAIKEHENLKKDELLENHHDRVEEGWGILIGISFILLWALVYYKYLEAENASHLRRGPRQGS